MTERTMSDEHKAAIAAGRIEAAAVRNCLEALESNSPKPGRRVTPEKLQERRAEIDAQFAAGDVKLSKRPKMLQGRRNIEAHLAAITDESETSTVEAGFVKYAASYGTLKGRQHAAWLEARVSAELRAKAGNNRGNWDGSMLRLRRGMRTSESVLRPRRTGLRQVGAIARRRPTTGR